MEKLSKELVKANKKILLEKFKDEKEMNFYIELVNELNKKEHENFENITNKAIFLAYFRTLSTNISHEKLLDFVKQNEKELENIGNRFEPIKNIENVKFNHEVNLEMFEENKNYAEETIQVILKINYYKHMSYLKNKYNESFYSEDYDIISINDPITLNNNMFDNVLNSLKSTLSINDSKYKIINRCKKLINQKNKFEAHKKKKSENICNLFRIVKGSLNEYKPIVLDKKTLSYCINDDITYELYRSCGQYNELLYKHIIKENKELKKRSISEFELLFLKNNLNFQNFSRTNQKLLLKYGKYDFIKYLLENKLNLIDDLLYTNIGVCILISSENIILDTISKYNISKDIIKKYPGILIKENIVNNYIGLNPLYNLLTKNIEILNKYNIKLDNNLNYIIDCNSDTLIDFLELSKNYNININWNLLKMSKNIKYIDNFIELGLGDFIKSNTDYLLKNPKNIIKRILICQMMKINIIKDNKLIDMILTGNNFYIKDNELDNYIILDSNFYSFNYIDTKNDIDPIINILNKKYQIDNNTYKINDVLLSKDRVINNLKIYENKLNYIDLINLSLIKNSLISNNQIEMINNETKKLSKKI